MPWICDCAFRPEIEVGLEAPDIKAEPEAFIEAQKHMTNDAVPMPVAVIPRQYVGVYSDSMVAQPRHGIVNVAGCLALTGPCAEIFRRFDLGGTDLVSVAFFQHDGTTAIPGEFYILNFGSRKDAFLPGKSKNVKQDMFRKDRWKLSGAKDGDVAVSGAALEGPDVWVDPALPRRFFISDGLAAAISDAGLEKGFFMTRCKVA